MNSTGNRPKGAFLPQLILLLFILFVLSDVARAWIAEWIYPMDESSLWKAPSYPSLFQEIERIRLARRFVPQDPRYAYQLTRLYYRVISQGLLDSSSKKRILAEGMKDFEASIRRRTIYPEYLAWFALFLHAAVEEGQEVPDSFKGQDPILLSEEKVTQALFLGRRDHNIQAFAAAYYQYRGMREASLGLWRSVVTEDPGWTEIALDRCFKYYQDSSFLFEIAPQERLEALVRFQEVLLTFRREGWEEKAYLKTLPLLIEKSQAANDVPALLEMIGRTYRQAGEYRQAFLWYERAFKHAKTPESRASLVLDQFQLLSQQERRLEAWELLKKHLDLSSIRPEILLQYAYHAWNFGEKKQAIEAMKKVVGEKDSPPEQRDALASFLYEEGHYQKAADEWQTLLHETQRTPYHTENQERILRRIQECKNQKNR